MNDLQIVETLRKKGLKKTAVRMAVLKHLSDEIKALSQPELETLFEGLENRVTVYRVLRDLEEKGLIHKVYDWEGTARFALCRSGAEYQNQHLHFNCVACKNVFCLEDIIVTTPSLPEGFKVQTVKLTVEGICKNCSEN